MTDLCLCVYANRFTPRVRRGEFPTLRDVDAYERIVEKRWADLQQHLAELSYHRTTRMPVKGRDYGLMGVHMERGEMLPDDLFTNFYGLIRYRDGQRVETFKQTPRTPRVSANHRGQSAGMPRYMQEEEVLLVTDDPKLAARTHEIMLEGLPAPVVAGDLKRLRLKDFIIYMIQEHPVIVLEAVVDLNPMVSNKGGPRITRVYGEGTICTGRDFPDGPGKN